MFKLKQKNVKVICFTKQSAHADAKHLYTSPYVALSMQHSQSCCHIRNLSCRFLKVISLRTHIYTYIIEKIIL